MRAFVIGGSGLVGRAIGRRLVSAGWQVDIVGRDPDHLPGDLAGRVRFFAADRCDVVAVADAFGSGADLLVDCVCFTPGHARALLPLAREAACTVVLSSKAVYVDSAGRHSNSDEPPRFAGPIAETQPTVAPGTMDNRSREGYGPNKVAAEHVLLDSGLPVSVLRPSMIHGQGARPPRSWVFVKRVLDERRTVLLAGRGCGVDHPVAAVNIAALVQTVAARPGRRILNVADPDAPTGVEIARIIARHLDHDWEEVLLDESVPAPLGWHPWDRRPPVVLDTSAAADLGYLPAGDFASTIGAEIDWLTATADPRRPACLPAAAADDGRFAQAFDYDREDRFLAGR